MNLTLPKVIPKKRSTDVNKALSLMNEHRGDNKKKGNYGEEAILALLLGKQEALHAVIYHSFSYSYARKRNGANYEGNIHRNDDGSFVSVDGNTGTKDEIDILLITPYRIFVIEAKARSGDWKIWDHWCSQSSRQQDKSPLAQTEKHCRHLYAQLYEYLPDGKSDYIVPITCFVDHARVRDARSSEFKKYIHVTILNTLLKKIMELNTPLDYMLDVPSIQERLRKIGNGRMYA